MARVKIVYEKTDASDIVRAAIDAEIARLELGLSRTNREIDTYEKKYAVSSADFLQKLTAEDLKGGDDDYVRWSGELKIRERILEDLRKLKDIEYVAN